MEIQKMKAIIEAILFAAGRVVTQEELVLALEIDKNQLEEIIKSAQEDYRMRGIEIIKVEKKRIFGQLKVMVRRLLIIELMIN